MLLRALTVASLLACLSVAAVWVRSHQRRDLVVYRYGRGATKSFEIHSVAGRVLFASESYSHRVGEDRAGGLSFASVRPGTPPHASAPWTNPFADRTAWSQLGFGHAHWRGVIGTDLEWRESTWWIPHWSACLAFAVLPLGRAAGRARRVLARRSRARRRLCLSCGYSLTDNASGVCPECGAAAGGRQ